MNHKNDIKIIKKFVGRDSYRTLACNSLKIRFGDKKPYIWIDPPWELWDREELVTTSLNYPESEKEFENFSNALNPLNKNKLLGFEHTIKNGLSLHFQNGLKLHIPTTIGVVDENDFYHHWYASD